MTDDGDIMEDVTSNKKGERAWITRKELSGLLRRSRMERN
jgi:hypothetical protein